MAYDLVRDLPEKLRVTAALLGRGNQKDLCAAFRRVNPNSDFDLDRSYKWMQGRAQPRSARVYEDWAALVGTEDRAPSWLAACALGEFVDARGARHGLEPAALLRRAGLNGTARSDEEAPALATAEPDGGAFPLPGQGGSRQRGGARLTPPCAGSDPFLLSFPRKRESRHPHAPGRPAVGPAAAGTSRGMGRNPRWAA